MNKTYKNKIGKIYGKTVLDNGMRIISEEFPACASFALGVSANAGSRDDAAGKSGLAHFVEHTAFRSTKKRTAKQIAREFENLGAYSNAFTTKDMTCYYVRALKEKFSKIADILLDLTSNPIFAEKDAEKERSIIIEEIRSYEDDPEELIFDYGDKLIYGDSGPAFPIAGYVETVENIQSSDLIEFHDKYYVPSNLTICSAGCVPHELLVEEASKLTNFLKPSPPPDERRISSDYSPDKVEVFKPFQQAHILFCRRVEGMESAERYPMAIVNVLLGDGFSSRLYQNLREKHGLAYSVYSSLQTMKDMGGLYIYAGADDNRAAKAEKLMLEEIDKLKKNGISKTEFNRAKEQIKSSTIMALESLSTSMQSIAKSEFALGVYEDEEKTIEDLASVTYADVGCVIDKYFDKNDWCGVIFKPEVE